MSILLVYSHQHTPTVTNSHKHYPTAAGCSLIFSESVTNKKLFLVNGEA